MNNNLSVGDRAVDIENNDSVIITEVTNDVAEEVHIKSINKTVAEANPQYDARDKVVAAVFESALSSNIPNWPFKDAENLSKLVKEHQVKPYLYPVSRLKYVNSAFLDGVTLRVAGVSDPIKQKTGSYYYEIISDGEKIFTQENTIGSNFKHVDKKIATYSGIISGLTWIVRNKSNLGVVIETEDGEVYKQINYGNEVESDELKELADKISETREKLPYCTIKYVDRDSHREVIERAIESFKKEKNSA